MKLKPFKTVPFLLTLGVIAIVCAVRWTQFGPIEELEAKTYDWRMRQAIKFPAPIATNFGWVVIQDESIARVSDGSLGYRYGLYWPRHVYGRALRELHRQGAKAVGFDVVFGEQRGDHGGVLVNTNQFPDVLSFHSQVYPKQALVTVGELASIESDDFFAWRLKTFGNAFLAANEDVLPFPLLRTNALATADISTEKDSDGVLRRVKVFNLYRKWNRAFQQLADDFGYDLDHARVERHKVILHTHNDEELTIPLDKDGNFDLEFFVGEKIPKGWKRFDKPYSRERVWHMGIVLAAHELKLNLENAQVDLDHGKIVLRGDGGVQRVVPVDREGYFYVDWAIRLRDERLLEEPIEQLLKQDQKFLAGETTETNTPWKDKIAIVGSIASGNDLTDRGPTPLEKDTALVSKHWNVANSVITGQFIRRTSLTMDCLLIAAMGVLTALLTWNLRAVSSFVAVAIVSFIYLGLCLFLFIQHRIWLPIFVPVIGSILVNYVSLMTWRVVFEDAAKRHVKNIFSHVVSPNVVNELLRSEKLSLGGAQREVSVLFADVRGFTQLTDASRERASEYVQARELRGAAAEAVFEEQARETLSTVNLYLALVADMVKKHNGTLDKYIGDCVMAFWGAPTSDPHHAASCVRAATDAQRAIEELNQSRAEENKRREQENAQRTAAGLPPLAPLPLLQLGSGINSGVVTVGLMGSAAHILNYTVFGREVNLASRLEGVSGRGRVIISEATFAQLQANDPDLAAKCIPLESVNVKGIRDAVKIYEVPWNDATISSSAESLP